MTSYQHNILSKLHCQILTFIGLCLAMLFVCSSNKTFAYGIDGFPATPTPVPSFLSYQVDVLAYDGYSHISLLDYPMQQISNTSNVSFYSTYLRSCLETAIDNYNQYYNLSINPDLSSLLTSLSIAYPFNAHNPFICLNFLTDHTYLYIIPDFHIFHFDADPQYNRLQSGYFYNLRIVPSYIYFRNNDLEYFVPFYSKFDDNGSYLNQQFAFASGTSLNNRFPWNDTFSSFHELELPYQNSLKPFYRYNYSDGTLDVSYGLFLNITSNLAPLVIMNPIYTTLQYYDLSVGEIYPSIESAYGNFYLYFRNITSEQLEDISNLYQEPYYWVERNFNGLTYTFNYEPVPVTPIPTFSPINTPSPVPTYFIPVTITPITLPVNPIIDTAYGDPISYIMAMINMVGSVLSSNVVTFFSTVVSYIYNSSIFFEILMFVIPAIILIAFVVGRLKKK